MTNSDLVALLEDAHKLKGHPSGNDIPHWSECPWCKRRDAALTALKSGAVVLVPGEPTEEMLVAIMDAAIADTSNLPSGAAYRAMLACCAKGTP